MSEGFFNCQINLTCHSACSETVQNDRVVQNARSETVQNDRVKFFFYSLIFFKGLNCNVSITSRGSFVENLIKIGRLIRPSALMG